MDGPRDKFEEDVLGKYSAPVRAARKVTAYLGEAVPVEPGRKTRAAAPELTDLLEDRVQEMLDRHGRAGEQESRGAGKV